MIFGGHVEFGGHFGYSLYGRKRYSQETTIFFPLNYILLYNHWFTYQMASQTGLHVLTFSIHV